MKKNELSITGYQKDFINMESIYPDSSLGRLVTVVKLAPEINLKKLINIIDLLPKKLLGLNYFYEKNMKRLIKGDLGKQKTEIRKYGSYKDIIFDIEKTYRGLSYKKKLYDIFIAETSDSYYLAIYTSHLICDASGIMKINDRIFEYYHNDFESQELVHSSFIQDYENYVSSSKFLKDESFWDSKVDELIENECYKKNCLSIDSFRKSSVISGEIENNILKVCENYNISKALLVSSFFCLQKMKETGIKTAIIGSPISTKKKKDKNLLGHYINILPFKMTVTEDTFFKQINLWKTEWFKILRHAYYPLVEINKKVFEKGKKGEYIDCLVNYIYAEFTNDLKKSVLSDVAWEANEELVFPMKITISNRKEPLIEIDAKKELFSSDEVLKIEENFYEFVNRLALQSDWKLSDLMSLEENKAFSIDKILQENYQIYSDKLCVVTEDINLTYSQVFQESNKVYNKLKELQIPRQSIVGVYMDRGVNIISSMLGIIRAGCVFLPINSEVPDSRINYILEDASPAVIISDQPFKSDISIKKNIPIIMYESLKNSGSGRIYFDNQSSLKSDLIYIIYTSGTTGNPKGVEVTRENLESLFDSCFSEYNFSEKDTWMQLHSNTFDFSIWEIFGALLNGSKLVVLKKETIVNKIKLAELIKKHCVNILNITPQAFYHLISNNNHLNVDCFKYVVFGGDKLDYKRIEGFYKINKKTEIYNMYGITEITIHGTIKRITDSDFQNNFSNIGRPLRSLTFFLLNEKGKVCEEGEIGEIVVVGEGVANGYLGNIAETRKKFKSFEINNEYFRAYFTGDSGRYLKNGEIEYLERLDSVVNIRGYRVGMAEINEVISKQENVSNVYTMVYRENSREDLISFIELDKVNKQIDMQVLKQAIELILPKYMIPNKMFYLDEIPLNINGKVDKEKLIERFIDQAEVDTKISDSNYRKRIEEIWKEILHLNQLDNAEDFFDVGGDSIKSIQFLSELEDLGIFIEINDFLEHPTLDYCLSHIPLETNLDEVTDTTSIVENAQSFLPLISNYIMTPDSSTNFIQSVAIDLPMDVSEELVVKLIEAIQKEFDTFRIIQINLQANCLTFSNQLVKNYVLIDWGFTTKKEEQNLMKKINQEAYKSFSENIIMRVDRIQKEDYTKLVFSISHLLIDGFSWIILFKFIEKYLFDKNSIHSLNTKNTHSYRRWLSSEYQAIELSAIIEGRKNIVIENRYKDTKAAYFKLAHCNNIDTQQMENIYLTAFIASCFEYIPEYEKEIIVEKEMHNRTKENAKLIGWFTRMYEMKMKNTFKDIEKLFHLVSEKNRQSNHLNEKTFIENFIHQTDKKRSIRFNYLTNLELDNCNQIKISDLFFENLINPSDIFKNDFEINIVPRNGNVLVQIRYLEKFAPYIKDIKCSFYENVMNLRERYNEFKRPKIEYICGKNKEKIFLIPPSMPYFGYSIIYKKIAQLFSDNYEVYMLTHFKSENILDEFINIVKETSTDKVILMGYSFGGTIAVEIARSLTKLGVTIDKVILFDSFVVNKNRFDQLDMNEEETLEFLIKDFIRKKSGREADIYNEEMLEELIDDYKMYHFATREIYTKREVIDTDIINFVTENEIGWNGERREGWNKLCNSYHEIPILGEHTEIFDSKYFDKNAKIIIERLNSLEEVRIDY